MDTGYDFITVERDEGLEDPLEDTQVAQWSYSAMKAMLTSQDAVEGPKAFMEKRRAVWKAI